MENNGEYLAHQNPISIKGIPTIILDFLNNGIASSALTLFGLLSDIACLYYQKVDLQPNGLYLAYLLILLLRPVSIFMFVVLS
jgi:hypothetical protein